MTCRKTVKCFVSDEGNPSAALSVFNCAGVCAIRVSYLRDRKLAAMTNGMKPKDVHEVDEKVIHLCQQQRTYPSSAVDVCTDTKVRYPNLQMLTFRVRKFRSIAAPLQRIQLDTTTENTHRQDEPLWTIDSNQSTSDEHENSEMIPECALFRTIFLLPLTTLDIKTTSGDLLEL
ncbi:unnamed protein product [Angiostrongylus costaricensis]|uniref:Uncharacterized protein n=1 Tax=Angiostrongylus costaricensis TaxID=334426 RepID=A0A0R3PRC2_ANGCS|nr:unnamed protein product [Angiostrongylus costaricensis]